MIGFDCRLDRKDFSFDVRFETGAGITALFGPSGSGKSTAIRLLAGIEAPNHGRIAAAGSVLVDTAARIFVRPHRRRIGLVFQDALLLPHLSVRSNLTYGRWFTAPGDRRVGFDSVVQVLGIGHLLARAPATLSGGERQRVAIGRALLTSPRLLLMDEPLASLDADRKLEILPFIEKLRDEFAIPIIYVSHAVEEVARLASHVIRLDRGTVVAAGTPAAILAANPGMEGFDRLGAASVLSAPVRENLPGYGLSVLAHPAGDIVVPGLFAAASSVRAVVRATNVALARERPVGISVRTILTGEVVRLDHERGPFVLVTVRLPTGELLMSAITRLALDSLALEVGDRVHALVKAVSTHEHGLAGRRDDPGQPD